MNITPKYQKLGLGKRLLDVMAKHLSLYGNSYLYLITENKRTRGYGFYKHYGFKEVKKYFTGSLALTYNIKRNWNIICHNAYSGKNKKGLVKVI